MKFRSLQDNLRKILLGRIEAGELTGLRLAQQTGFKQAHISNFLNRKRGLSLDGMDTVLAALHLSVLDLLDPAEINRRASILPPPDGEFESVALADCLAAATHPLIAHMYVRDILKFKKTFLRKLKPSPEGERSTWQRFVLIRLSAKDALPMSPRLTAGATLLLDRHYNSLKPYRKNEWNLYAVLKNDTCAVRYVESSQNEIILRPHNQSHPIEVIPVAPDKQPTDYIAGRVCHISQEA